ncbi:unnamed protein product [Fraxinus pennsylvanica]|uniref:RDR1/2-like PH-like domain-containing protein n=1 Tax=Fraxinus pennsylvanica TaxID=56036 RepID=A0AAD1YPF3_9LAMI|nr:unnamed protein product [Fraxinus pennsylvanica]
MEGSSSTPQKPRIKSCYSPNKINCFLEGRTSCFLWLLMIVITRLLEPRNGVEEGNGITLFAVVMIRGNCLGILEFWGCVKLWVVPERKRHEHFLNHQGEFYKLEV